VGYVDAHVHLHGPGCLESLRTAQIIAARDAGTADGFGLTLSGADASGPPPVIRSAGWALLWKGGYGARLGIAVGSRDDIEQELARLAAAKAGIIKVMASGMVSLKRPGEITAGGFAPADLAFLVDRAAVLGLPVMAHANGEAAVLAAVRSGVSSIEHGFFMTERCLGAMADRGTFWVPTAGALLRAAERRDVSAGAREFVQDQLRSHLAMMRRAHRLGVALAVGTDCVLPDPNYCSAYEQELRLFGESGLGDDDVRRMACENGMRLMGTGR
jgi:imidazolonepropionase-like amidohydrolase